MKLIKHLVGRMRYYYPYKFTKFSHNNDRHKLRAMLDKYHIDLVLDVGANKGQFATKIRKMGYKGQIISFEPLKTCYEHLLTIADPQWQVENYALGDTQTTKDIHVSVGTDFSSILPANDYGNAYFSKWIKVAEKQRIQVNTLDEALPRLVDDIAKRNIFLKIDTQGYDHLVMLGAASTLAHVDALLTEVSCKAIYQGTPSAHETIKQLADKGFSIAGIYPISYDEHTLGMIEFDCLAVREKPAGGDSGI